MEASMRQAFLPVAACGAALTLFALGAHAVTCDVVLDRNNTVVYQDVTPPVDLSERGAAAREKMRQRGELLMIIDTDQCPRLVYSSVTGTASVDEIVAGMRPYIATTGGMGRSARPGATAAVSTASMPTPAATPARSTSGRSY
jgi:hypothetical protein